MLSDYLKLIYANLPKSIKSQSREIYLHWETRIRLALNKGSPLSVAIETDTSCTRKCDYCPGGREIGSLDESLFQSVIEDLKNWGYKGNITLQGYYEPLIDERLEDFSQIIKKNLPETYLFIPTNGDLLDSSRIEKLIESGVDEIRVSIHNPSSEDFIRKILTYEKRYDVISKVDRRDGHRISPLSNRGGAVDIGEIDLIGKCSAVSCLTIRASGNVVPCFQDFYEIHPLGNISEKGVKEIWDQSSKMRNDQINGRNKLSICGNCGYEKI